jgi:hypothetical protein
VFENSLKWSYVGETLGPEIEFEDKGESRELFCVGLFELGRKGQDYPPIVPFTCRQYRL